MSNKYETGTYIVRLFDRYGTKRHDLTAVSYVDGHELGHAQKGDGSFVLLRTVYNSLDPHPTAKYDIKEDE